MINPIKPVPMSLNPTDAYNLTRIIGSLKRRIEFLAESTISLENTMQINRLTYLHDVLEIHNCRNNPDTQDLWLEIKRPWQTEYDIPLHEYVAALNSVVVCITELFNHHVINQSVAFKLRRDEQIAFIVMLKNHRMSEEGAI